MKGLDLSEDFYWEIVRPLIAERFPQLVDKHAAGLIGYGSDVLFAALPGELQQLEIPGALDQLITSDQVLIWADHYSKIKPVYSAKSDITRDGIGDMIV